MCELVFLKHLTLDKGLHSVDLPILLLLDQLHLAKSPLANDLKSIIVLWLVFGTKESQVLALLLARVRPGLLTTSLRLVGISQALLHLTLSVRAMLVQGI